MTEGLKVAITKYNHLKIAADILISELQFDDNGPCKGCGGRFWSFTKHPFEVKVKVRDDYFKLYKNQRNVTYGIVNEIKNKITQFS